MKFLSSVLLLGTLTVFGGRLQAGDEAAAIPLRASCDCSWTSESRCPGFAKKGSKNARNDHSICYHYCCGGLSQCLKCDKKRTSCSTTNDEAQCAKFRKTSSGLWKETKTGQCLDMFTKTRFGLWPCKHDHVYKNQANKNVGGGKYCFDWRGGKPCVEDPSKNLRIKDGNSKCLVCDQKDKLCGAPKSSMGECSDFERIPDGFYKVKSTGQCLDRWTAGWGLWKCRPLPNNHRFLSNLTEENIAFFPGHAPGGGAVAPLPHAGQVVKIKIASGDIAGQYMSVQGFYPTDKRNDLSVYVNVHETIGANDYAATWQLEEASTPGRFKIKLLSPKAYSGWYLTVHRARDSDKREGHSTYLIVHGPIDGKPSYSEWEWERVSTGGRFMIKEANGAWAGQRMAAYRHFPKDSRNEHSTYVHVHAAIGENDFASDWEMEEVGAP